ncbi:Hypothetical predicted protein [Marmota monax]|uniref:Peptidase S1 domain-containing protein n=1 Tax=Marmota monax TaxID=9995 RepID=A0A5E4AQ05_MARMO|nr:Hypothetical predicted protein [Marmota monax]
MKDFLILLLLSATGESLGLVPASGNMQGLEGQLKRAAAAAGDELKHLDAQLVLWTCSLSPSDARCLIKIRLGVYQPSINNKKEQVQNYSLTMTHPDFDANSLENDLMMIKLSKPVALNNYVGTIAISLEHISSNESCFIPTWTWNDYKNLAFAYNPDYTGAITPSYLVYLKSDYLPCVGALIHPLWVITAAHCNLPKSQQPPQSAMEYSTESCLLQMDVS